MVAPIRDSTQLIMQLVKSKSLRNSLFLKSKNKIKLVQMRFKDQALFHPKKKLAASVKHYSFMFRVLKNKGLMKFFGLEKKAQLVKCMYHEHENLGLNSCGMHM